METIHPAILLGGAAVCFGVACLQIRAMARGAPFVPTWRGTRRAMLDAAGLKPNEHLIDLGSGDGSIVLDAARRGALAHGVEQSRVLCWITRVRALTSGLGDRVSVACGDLFEADVANADVISCFLLQGTNQKLKDKLLRECRPGTRVISHAFTFDGWKEDVILPRSRAVHLYRVP